MEGEEVSKLLPEELIETIIAMMPFPSIYKARGLSKLWLTRFSAISSVDSDEEKLLAASFQKKVAQWSHNWETFRLVYNYVVDLVGYDQVSRKGRQSSPLLTASSLLQIEEGFMYWNTGCMLMRSNFRCTEGLYVANIVKREWKQLPPLPNSCPGYVQCLKLVRGSSSEMYKMIMVCQVDDYEDCCIHIYDSASGTWSSQVYSFEVGWYTNTREFEINRETSAYLNGILYMIPRNWGQFCPRGCLLALNVEDATVEEIKLEVGEGSRVSCCDVEDIRLVVCLPNLFLAVIDSDSWTVRILQIDVAGAGVIWEVVVASAFKLGMSETIIGEVYCTFDLAGVMLAYNEVEQKWIFHSFRKTPYNWICASNLLGLPHLPVEGLFC